MFFDDLMRLPGVGIYIAAAVRTFAFSIPDFPVDSNGFRFVSRFFGKRIKGTKNEARQIREFMNQIIDKRKPKEFVYGFLDFCSSVCTPTNPTCERCKLNTGCHFFRTVR
jgi:A/G-specific adenine glycosylase